MLMIDRLSGRPDNTVGGGLPTINHPILGSSNTSKSLYAMEAGLRQLKFCVGKSSVTKRKVAYDAA